ncbi:sigma factor [Arthrobacter bambusae]
MSTVMVDHLIAAAVMSPRTRGAVWSILASAGLGQDTDDVVADAAEAAVKSAAGFDPGLGPVEAWVMVIAKRRAYDHVKRAGSRSRLHGRLEAEASGPDAALSATVGDFSDELVDRVDGEEHARKVLGLTAALVANPVSYRRVAALWMSYQGDTGKAAAALGITPAALRDSCREVRRCAHVVRRGLEARKSGIPVTVGALLGCLPSGGEDGVWATALSRATVRAGGFGRVQAADLAAVTGYSLNTCRQYMVEALWLLQVARTVMEQPPTNHAAAQGTGENEEAKGLTGRHDHGG